MLRAVLLGLLSVTALSACGKKAETSASAQPGAPAGKVIEVKGAVTVKVGDATKPLAVGDSVDADATVITGADGNVVIELAHNSARWTLGPNKQQKVRDSIAWKAAKTSGPAQHNEQETAAAGRPAERSAAGTVASAVEAEEAAPAAEAAMAAPPAAAAPAPPPPPPEPDSKADKADADDAPAPKPTRRRASAPKATASSAAADSLDEPAADAPRLRRGATMKKGAAAPAPGGGGGGSLESIGLSGVGAGGGGVGAGATARASADDAGPTVTQLLAKRQADLKTCMANHTSDIRILVKVDAGQPTIKLNSATQIPAAVDVCMKKVIGSITFSGAGGGIITIKP